MWIDIGINSTHAPLATAFPEVRARARDAGVRAGLLTGTNLDGAAAAWPRPALRDRVSGPPWESILMMPRALQGI